MRPGSPISGPETKILWRLSDWQSHALETAHFLSHHFASRKGAVIFSFPGLATPPETPEGGPGGNCPVLRNNASGPAKRASRPDFDRILIGRPSKSALCPAVGRTEGDLMLSPLESGRHPTPKPDFRAGNQNTMVPHRLAESCPRNHGLKRHDFANRKGATIFPLVR